MAILLISTKLRTLNLPKHHFHLVAHQNKTTDENRPTLLLTTPKTKLPICGLGKTLIPR